MLRPRWRHALPMFSAFVCACASGPRVIRTYAGPGLPPERIATLELRAPEEDGDGSCDDRHFRLEVDGTRYEQCRDILQLAPGRHTLRAIPEPFELDTFNPLVNGPMRTRAGYALAPNQAAALTFVVEPGRSYVFVHDRITTTQTQALSIQAAIRRKDTSAPIAAGTMKWVP